MADDMRDAFRKAGYNPPNRSEKGGNFVRRDRRGDRGPRRGGGGDRGRGEGPSLPPDCLLESYYNDEGKLKREVFDRVPKKLAGTFQGRMKASALRKFYECVRSIRDKLVEGGGKDFDQCQSDLFALLPKVEYQQNREIVPAQFVTFMRHNIELASKSPENLKGFHQLFESVVCYFKERGGR